VLCAQLNLPLLVVVLEDCQQLLAAQLLLEQ
jgi:hypothetical protein